jgi:hypothetical protein
MNFRENSGHNRQKWFHCIILGLCLIKKVAMSKFSAHVNNGYNEHNLAVKLKIQN